MVGSLGTEWLIVGAFAVHLCVLLWIVVVRFGGWPSAPMEYWDYRACGICANIVRCHGLWGKFCVEERLFAYRWGGFRCALLPMMNRLARWTSDIDVLIDNLQYVASPGARIRRVLSLARGQSVVYWLRRPLLSLQLTHRGDWSIKISCAWG